MITAAIDNLRRISLDTPQFAHLGYRPGQIVEISALSTGSLLVRIADTPPLDAKFRPITKALTS